MEKHLHIICFNVPYPVNYGGVFDLFYKLPALQQQGLRIHLHCFEYGRGEQKILKTFCESVSYYKRLGKAAAFSLRYPYIVNSRKNEELAINLAKDDYPILMEGIHSTYLLNDSRFTHRRCFVRLHNVEHIYYKHLYRFSNSLLQKMYFLSESFLLRIYEKRIADKATFLSVTKKDIQTFKDLGSSHIQFVPLFLPDWKVNTADGNGTFCLYHGDLSVAENEIAALWLLKEVFNDLSIPFVIAGKGPSNHLIKQVHNNTATCLIADPDEKEMQDLIAKAHINIIPSYNTTGIKLKLINALFNGRHCLVNEQTIAGTGLDKACLIASTASEFKTAISEIYTRPFCHKEISLRQQLLDGMFDNKKNAALLLQIFFG